MMKKILISVLVACSLFVVSMGSVLAADETETITDDEDDVYDMESDEEVSTKPNIDVVKVTYERQDDIVTITVTVKGEIENKGNIEEATEETDSIEYVAYQIAFLTSQESLYEIVYVNNGCQLGYSLSVESDVEMENLSEDDFSVDDSNLTISFALKNTSETYGSLEVATEDAKFSITTYEWFVDYASDFEEGGDGDGDSDGDGDGDGDSDGDGDGDGDGTGETDSSNSGILIFAVAIGVIVVMGVAVLVYIIRR